MKTSLIIHGHFYQPPRENPYTGKIPVQKGAAPYENWNEAVYRTCYRPNAYSRYLGPDGMIRDICNNYCGMSANFGPTLLNWIMDNHSHFKKRLADADRDNMYRLGHSSFLAQGFNHTILPLDSPQIREIEIKWAIDYYRSFFGHDPEGFWCPECAIDPNTIDDLVDNGIRFVVLSPWQAESIEGRSLGKSPAPCDRPFLVKGNRNEISVFFYDPELASGISFGHYLRDADRLYSRLCEIRKERKNPKLINWATDGEIYGHHEPFGDMGLAALMKKIDEGGEFELTNYGAYLANHPATEHAKLKKGDEGLGTSWSCHHGVGRWMRDCSCHTGGDDCWNQKWRAPMRAAFENNETLVRSISDNKISKILGTGWNLQKLMLSASGVICRQVSELEFARQLCGNDADAMIISDIFDSYRNVLYSFTSCGWFFNDISGIEPRQNMLYALCAAEKIAPYADSDPVAALLSDLSLARSNIQSEGSGADLLKRDRQTMESTKEADTIDQRIESFNMMVLNNGIDETLANMIIDTVTYARNCGLNPDVTHLQEILFPYMRKGSFSRLEPKTHDKLAVLLNFSL